MSRVIYACDIGSVIRKKFAWARLIPNRNENLQVSQNINELIECLISDARKGYNIALGFESPLFLPIPYRSDDLSRGRENETNRSVFAQAGAAVTTLGIHEAAWILRSIKSDSSVRLTYTIDPADWGSLHKQSQVLFIWEVFVSGSAHSAKGDDEHCRDAATAVTHFMEIEESLLATCNITATSCINLIHSVALWAGWSSDTCGLHQNCLVVKPTQPYSGDLPIYKAKKG